MKYAADFRALARGALRGKWLTAVLTGFLASLIGAGIATEGGFSSSGRSDSGSVTNVLRSTDIWPEILPFVGVILLVCLFYLLIIIVISGAGQMGYAVFNLKLVDHKEVHVSDLFSQFHRLNDGFCMNLLRGLFIFLWTLLLIIPGIIKSYSYAMTPYILAENPGMTATNAITESRRIMEGNKWRLFCLEISFIGWDLLCVAPILIALWRIYDVAVATGSLSAFLWLIPWSIPCFVGAMFLNPYKEAAQAAFYREISGTEYSIPNADWG